MCSCAFPQMMGQTPQFIPEYNFMSMNHEPGKKMEYVSLFSFMYSFHALINVYRVWCDGTVQRRLALEQEVKRNERLQSEQNESVTQVHFGYIMQ